MRKGISPLISWVLLIGLVVAVGALVTNWAIQQAQRINVTEIAEGGLYCDGVALSVDGFCKDSTTGDATKLKMKFKNRGNFNIKDINVDLKDGSGVKSEKYGLLDPIEVSGNKQIQIQILAYKGSLDYIKLTPLIEVEGNLRTCPDKKVLLSDSDLIGIEECCDCANPSLPCTSICP